MENGRRFQHGPEGEEHPGRGEVEVCRPAGARRVERQERGDQGPDGSSRERAAASNEARQMGAKHRGEGEDGDLWDGYPGAAVDGNERSLERCSEVDSSAWISVPQIAVLDRKSTRLNSSHGYISYAVFCLKKKKKQKENSRAKEKKYEHKSLLKLDIPPLIEEKIRQCKEVTT